VHDGVIPTAPGDAVTEAVSWDLAERVAVRVAGREPFAESYHYSSLQPDFEELTVEAEELVARATGLRSLAGPARARVTDRPGWVRANVASFQRLLRPVTERLGPRLLASPIAPVSRAAAGVQVGTVLGWMSTRVLGQYDLLLAEDERIEEQDIVYYVGPNVLSLEKRFSFPPRQFRLWLALHEVTHRAQFTGIPWMRPHFLSLVDQTLGAMDPDPRRFLEGLRRAADEVRRGRNPLSDGGLLGLVMGTEQHAVLGKVQGLMSLLEGHGDVTMDRAGAARIPSAERFSRVLRDRRRQVRGPARLLQQLIGLEAKMRQYEDGEQFVAAVEAAGGPEMLGLAWRAPDALPTLDEIRDPPSWMRRVRAG
jgi:coenzyme F420 biosynthesis associated uncharacterized protein